MLKQDQLAKLLQMKRELERVDYREEQKKQAEFVKQCVKDNVRNMGKCPVGERRNDVLVDIVNDDKVYEISFVVDALMNYDKVHNLQKKVVGCRAVLININGEDHLLDHTWLREVYVPEVAKYNRYRDLGRIITLKVKVKGYDENNAKYEFTTIY